MVVPEDVGAYALAGGQLKSLPVEVVSLKSSGMLKAMATIGISKAKINGLSPASQAPSDFRHRWSSCSELRTVLALPNINFFSSTPKRAVVNLLLARLV
jgi:hypothetical protein